MTCRRSARRSWRSSARVGTTSSPRQPRARVRRNRLARLVNEAQQILEQFTTWAVVGCSPDPGRASHDVARFLQARGKRVIPVNPNACPGQILGEDCYPDLRSLAERAEVVDIFRRSDLAR